jgi:hypothetical protein
VGSRIRLSAPTGRWDLPQQVRKLFRMRPRYGPSALLTEVKFKFGLPGNVAWQNICAIGASLGFSVARAVNEYLTKNTG